MAEVVKLVQSNAGGTDRELDLKDTSNFETKKVFLQAPPDNELWHSPDHGESGLVSTQASDRPCQLDMTIFGSSATDEDGLQNNIVTLRRWLKKAQRAEMENSIYPVYLYLQKNLASNAVKHRIKSGYIDDSLSHYIAERHQGKVQALHVTVNVILAPYGEWDSTVVLENAMFSSPHFVEDSNSDGEADGWSQVGTPSLTLNTSLWLVGGQSQRVVTDDNSTEGISSDVVTAVQSENLVAYAWVHLSTGNPVTVWLSDGDNNVIQAKTATAGNADKTTTDDEGNTWYRIVVGGSNTVAADARIHIARLIGDASTNTTFFVDACYLDTGTTTAPDAWMSARNIDNRGDIRSATQTTENYLNYWDVWGVPGDAPALVKTLFNWTTTAANANLMHVGKIADGDLLAADEIYWIEDDDFATSISNGAESEEADAGRTLGHYYRAVDDGSATCSATMTISLAGSNARSFLHSPKRVMLLVRTDDTDSMFLAFAYPTATSINAWSSGYVYLDNANQWALLDMGVISLRGLLPLATDDGANQDITFGAALLPRGANKKAELDAVLFLPTEENILIACPNNIDFNPNTVNTYIDGRYKHAVNSDSPSAMPRQGTLWTVEPGNSMTRNIWAVQEMDVANKDLEGNHDPTIATIITLEITPRTRHLLGTE